MDVVTAILKPVVDILMVPVKENLGYMIYHRKYVVDMRKKTAELNDARVGVEDKKKQNNERCLEVPAEVSPWLEEVRQITDKLEAFPSDAVLGCLELKSRRKLGREAFEISETIQSVLSRRPQFPETDRKIPLGRIDSTAATTSSSDHHNNEIQSRVQTYNKALELLRPDHEHHMVALWGMGGVGKTTLMEKLRETVVEKRMFSYFALAVIGENLDVKAFQNSIALYLGIELNDQASKEARVDQLVQGYKAKLGGDKKKFLVILDDVWRAVDLEIIGLNRLPNQFKVLITSRNQDVCIEMGVRVDSILKVSLLDEAEAQSMFRQFLESYSTGDVELEEKVVRKCCGLPIAIKTMACTLRGKSNDTWKNALSSLQHDDVNTVFKTSYDNLHDEATHSVFLLCGLFPEDFNIRTEDLLRYGWGLNLFKGKDGIMKARYMLNTCIERLIHTNLLIKSDNVGCVKMHDLVRAFVLDMFSKVENASIVNHDSKPDWHETENDIRASCKRISLTCEAMYEFPNDLKFPNLTILKLRYGDKLSMFPRNFYEEMGKLQVISYDYMDNPLLPSSLDECSIKLRVLRLHKCVLRYDLSSIGNLENLEVLSFADSRIESLPSTVGQLKKLRLLDVTGCSRLCIDNGVFKNLVKLEELYAKVVKQRYRGPITFTCDNCNEAAERWNNLCALEFEFIENNAQWKNLSFEKLELFTISVGCSFPIDLKGSIHSFGNTLKLVTKKGELLKYKINELFKKTEVLSLSVDDTKDLKDIGVNSSSFRNIRVLVFSECEELRYLFTLDVAKVLSNLEQLRVDNCCVMKELIHAEIGGEETIAFPKLKIVSLFKLPNLLGFCQNVNISIALPQLVELHMENIPNITSIICSKNKSATSCLLRGEEVLIPKLEILYVDQMDNLKEIWPCDFVMREEGRLRKIEVRRCHNLVNLFPCNPMPLLHHLEVLEVWYCGSVEALFNIDLDCVGEAGEGGSSSLRRIEVKKLEKLEEVWRIKGANHSRIPIRGFQAVERIWIIECKRFRNVFSPTTNNFDMYMDISNSRKNGREYGLMESSQGQEFETQGISNSVNITMKLGNLKILYINGCDLLEHIFTFSTFETLGQLEQLCVQECKAIKVIVVKEEDDGEQATRASSSYKVIPRLKSIVLKDLPEVVGFFLGTNIQLQWPSLDHVSIKGCPQMKVFMAGGSTAPQLKYVETELGKHSPTNAWFNSDMTTTTTGQHLESTNSWYPAAASERTNILSFHNLVELCMYTTGEKVVVPSNELLHLKKLEKIHLKHCHYVEKVYEELEAGTNSTTGFDESPTVVNLPNLRQVDLDYVHDLRYLWKSNRWTIFEFPNLTTACIQRCDKLEHVFTSSMLGSLNQLQDLRIRGCERLEEVIVEDESNIFLKKEESDDGKTKEIVLPRLKSLKIEYLPGLKGFCLSKVDFSFPLLETLTINYCPSITTFTNGNLSTPKLIKEKGSLRSLIENWGVYEGKLR